MGGLFRGELNGRLERQERLKPAIPLGTTALMVRRVGRLVAGHGRGRIAAGTRRIGGARSLDVGPCGLCVLERSGKWRKSGDTF